MYIQVPLRGKIVCFHKSRTYLRKRDGKITADDSNIDCLKMRLYNDKIWLTVNSLDGIKDKKHCKCSL